MVEQAMVEEHAEMKQDDQAEELHNEGLRLFQEGLYDESAQRFSEAMEYFAEQGREVEVGEILKQGRWDEALESLEEAHRLFVRLEDKSREAQALGNLASVYASLKRREDAEKSWSIAASLFQELGDRQKQGETLMALGTSLFKSKRRQEGLATYQSGMGLLEKPTLIQRFYRFLLMLQTRLLG